MNSWRNGFIDRFTKREIFNEIFVHRLFFSLLDSSKSHMFKMWCILLKVIFFVTFQYFWDAWQTLEAIALSLDIIRALLWFSFCMFLLRIYSWQKSARCTRKLFGRSKGNLGSLRVISGNGLDVIRCVISMLCVFSSTAKRYSYRVKLSLA